MDKKFQLFFKPKYRIEMELNSEGIKEATRLVNSMNGVKDVYKTIYNYEEKVKGQNAYVDKVFLDFDPSKEDETSVKYLLDARNVARFLKDKGYRFSVFFSGRGFHIYIYCGKELASDLGNAGGAVRLFRDYIIDSTKIDLTPDVDNRDKKQYEYIELDHVTGDLMRVSRMPNTINHRTGLYCIPITLEELEKDLDDIHQLAKKPRKIDNISGQKLVDLKRCDQSTIKFDFKNLVSNVEGSNVVDIDYLPECVKAALSRGTCRHRERYYIITAMRDLAYSEKAVCDVLEKYLFEEHFIHCIDEEDQINYLFNERPDLVFPSCRTIKADGFCVEGCSGFQLYI